MAQLIPSEREAVLTYDEESNKWNIYCCSGKVNTKMKKAGFVLIREDEDGCYYEADYKQISFRSKSDDSKPKRKMSEEHKAKLLAGRQQSKK